jgi:hypothetical protein
MKFLKEVENPMACTNIEIEFHGILGCALCPGISGSFREDGEV